MAGKLTTYLVILSGMILMFYFTGILPSDTPNSAFLDLVLNPERFFSHSLTSRMILAVEAVGLGGAVIAGLIFGRNILLAAKSPFIIFFFNLGVDIVAIFGQVASVNRVIAVLVFAPFIILFIISIIEWWGGQD